MASKKKACFWCQECGKPFYTVKAAERATFGDSGCPKCGGSDIDCAPPRRESGDLKNSVSPNSSDTNPDSPRFNWLH